MSKLRKVVLAIELISLALIGIVVVNTNNILDALSRQTTPANNPTPSALFALAEQRGIEAQQIILSRNNQAIVVIDTQGTPHTLALDNKNDASVAPLPTAKANTALNTSASTQSAQHKPQPAYTPAQHSPTVSEAPSTLLDMAREKITNEYPDAAAIVYNPPAGTKVRDTLTIFTDPSCIYCRKLHGNIDKLLAAGYRVRYIPIARPNGVGPDGKTFTYDHVLAEKIQDAMCTDDPHKAIDALYRKGFDANISSDRTKCDLNAYNIKRNIKLAEHIVIAAGGTPVIMSKNGYVSRGLLPNGQPVPAGYPGIDTLITLLGAFEEKKQ
ncbi:MAG: hypothetical protein D6712_11110 [Chloroflexi bacterium]|nr:MAG: hypothetical protein D6712_11110 [Chloroflexota bacterium]